MVGVNNISVQFSGVPLFEGITFIINPRDRIGLIGRNGAGKTTLLRILHGLMQPHEGYVSFPNSLRRGFLEQDIELSSSKTVLEEALTAFEEANALEKTIDEISHDISHRTDYESAEYMRLINRLHEANDRFHVIGGHSRKADTLQVLSGLGFNPDDMDKPMATFSGGWQMRVELAKILLGKPDLVLLDEPTNHLDIESIQWLEDFLHDYQGAVVLVSHDRAFLDNVTNRTIEISLGKMYDYKCSYSEYVIHREADRIQQQAAYDNQQREIAQIERFVERFRYKATKARQVQSRVKLLEKMEKIEVEEADRSAIHFQFPPAPASGKVVVDAERMGKSFGPRLVLKDLNFSILRNDFVAFVGKNGMGKTTLSRIIIGELDHNGSIKLGHNVRVGYFAQNQAELLDQDKTVFQVIDDVATGDMRTRVRTILGNFLFSGETIDKKVKVLSGGEKSRLALARMLLTPVNLLVLDEPTNHLDMQSKDILKNALLHFGGTLIIVSHDRDFLQGLTNKVYEFRDHGIREYLGDIYDFLESRKLQSLRELEKKNAGSGGLAGREQASDAKLLYEQKKQLSRELKKIETQIQAAEKEITRLEHCIAAIDQVLSDPGSHQEKIRDASVYTEYESLKQKLGTEISRWESLLLQHEKIERG